MAQFHERLTVASNGSADNHMTTHVPKKILIVEDEADIAQLVKLYLEKDGFRTTIVSTGIEALTLIKTNRPDMAILDLMLPEMDGLEICRKIRMAPDSAFLPVLMLTAKAEESDTIIGLELGADDYITKPFSPKVLVTRVKALFRRLERTDDPKQKSYAYGPLLMDLARHEVKVDGKEIGLTAKEFGLLEQLLHHPGRVLTRDVLLNAVWGYDYYGTTRTVDVHIRRLKLKIPLLDEAIISVKSLGYKLSDQVPERSL
jgi:two-component system, OmpR family, alkaline phosphatase synthesis response regulator PhoP